jgi:hypothetical protein
MGRVGFVVHGHTKATEERYELGLSFAATGVQWTTRKRQVRTITEDRRAIGAALRGSQSEKVLDRIGSLIEYSRSVLRTSCDFSQIPLRRLSAEES